jgi:hypothetical protein
MIDPVVFSRSFDGQDILGLFYYTDDAAIPAGRSTDLTRVLFGVRPATTAESDPVTQTSDTR